YYICVMLIRIVLFISVVELFFILFIVIIVFGDDKIPDIAKGLGKGMRQLKDATEDIKQEIQKSADKQGIDTSIVDDIRGEIDNVKSKVRDNIDNVSGKVKENVDDVTGVIKRK